MAKPKNATTPTKTTPSPKSSHRGKSNLTNERGRAKQKIASVGVVTGVSEAVSEVHHSKKSKQTNEELNSVIQQQNAYKKIKLKSSSSVRSIYLTSINQFGYLCGASYPSSRPLLPLISFEALQSSAVFCHSRHTSNFLICVGYHQNNISISKTNYPRHILISKNLFDHAMIYQWQKVIGIVPAAFVIFSRQPKGILDSNQGEYVCHHLRATSPSAFLDKKPSGTPRASLSR